MTLPAHSLSEGQVFGFLGVNLSVSKAYNASPVEREPAQNLELTLELGTASVWAL